MHQGAHMPDFKLPLSGDVTQTINPVSMFFNPVGSQIGLININLGTSSEPKIENQVLSDVASYGKQLGRIGDALVVLLLSDRSGVVTGSVIDWDQNVLGGFD